MSGDKGTTFSDRELSEWAAIRRSDDRHTYWKSAKKGFSAEDAISALSREVLSMRIILRDFIARHKESTQDPLVLRAVTLLGMNLNPEQPLFVTWPQPSSPALGAISKCEHEHWGPVGYVCPTCPNGLGHNDTE